ncbi:putative acetyltransferase [Leucobacter sp. 7(1)]|nr:putative acetyltransferase [Leucobacter sp. 7(1)]
MQEYTLRVRIGSNVNVRALTAAERSREAVLAQAAWPERPEIVAPGEPENGSGAAGWVLGAFDDEHLLGSISVVLDADPAGSGPRRDDAELSWLVVAPGAEEQAPTVSDALLRGATEWALRQGCDGVELAPGTALSDGSADALTHSLQERADVRVREILDTEIPAVSELVLEAYREDYARLPEEYLAEIADVAARAKQHVVWVAEDRETGELLGTITTPRPGNRMSSVAREGEMDLRLLGVARAARGRRVGSLLMRHGLRLARLRGTPRVVLNTSTEMVAAYEMYDRMGFARLHDREQQIVREDGSGFTLLAYGIDVAA